MMHTKFARSIEVGGVAVSERYPGESDVLKSTMHPCGIDCGVFRWKSDRLKPDNLFVYLPIQSL